MRPQPDFSEVVTRLCYGVGSVTGRVISGAVGLIVVCIGVLGKGRHGRKHVVVASLVEYVILWRENSAQLQNRVRSTRLSMRSKTKTDGWSVWSVKERKLSMKCATCCVPLTSCAPPPGHHQERSSSERNPLTSHAGKPAPRVMHFQGHWQLSTHAITRCCDVTASQKTHKTPLCRR